MSKVTKISIEIKVSDADAKYCSGECVFFLRLKDGQRVCSLFSIISNVMWGDYFPRCDDCIKSKIPK